MEKNFIDKFFLRVEVDSNKSNSIWRYNNIRITFKRTILAIIIQNVNYIAVLKLILVYRKNWALMKRFFYCEEDQGTKNLLQG